MFNPISVVTRTTFAAIALSIATVSLPAMAGDNSLLIEKHEHKCQSIEKAARALKKSNYKHVEYQGLAKEECLYVFAANKKRNGEYWSWIIYYDAYDREIVGREPQKKEEAVEM